MKACDLGLGGVYDVLKLLDNVLVLVLGLETSKRDNENDSGDVQSRLKKSNSPVVERQKKTAAKAGNP